MTEDLLLSKTKGNAILHYCVDRILVCNKIYDTKLWTVNICDGYYGQETNGADIDVGVSQRIVENVKALKGMSDIEMIHHVLKLEYGYILDMLKYREKVSIIEVSTDDLIFPQNEYKSKVSDEDIGHYYERSLPIAVCIKASTGNFKTVDGVRSPSEFPSPKYKIVDGYHRSIAAMKSGEDKAEVIFLSEGKK